VEPHDHGILVGSVQVLSWQVAGSSCRPNPNWRLTKVDEMADLLLLNQTIPGGRPVASGKHIVSTGPDDRCFQRGRNLAWPISRRK
jgi:hypothetical protein